MTSPVFTPDEIKTLHRALAYALNFVQPILNDTETTHWMGLLSKVRAAIPPDQEETVTRGTLPSGRTIDVYQKPNGELRIKTRGHLTAYGKKWEKEILPAIQKRAVEASGRIRKRFGERGEHFDSATRRTANAVIEWLLTTDQRSLPPKVLNVEVDSALDYLEAWMIRTDALEEALRECSRIGHEHCCLSPGEVAEKIDWQVGEVLGKTDTWPVREKKLHTPDRIRKGKAIIREMVRKMRKQRAIIRKTVCKMRKHDTKAKS